MTLATFDLAALLKERDGEGYQLHPRYLNPQLQRTMHVIGFDKVYVRAEGTHLYDSQGNCYADWLTGFGVSGLGRNHPVVRQALQQMLDLELADMVQFDCPLLAGLLAEKLLEKAPGLERVFFCNSGAEAVEAALKFARCATGRQRVLYWAGAFHGLTYGALAVNGDETFREGFGELPGATMIPPGDLDALEAELAKGDVAALIVEPVQGHGAYVVPDGYLAAARTLLRDHGALLICDEVQSGLGRTGRFFAYQHDDVEPDIITVAKALSGGYIPVGATLAKDWIFQKVYPDMNRVLAHDSTFGGNNAAMTAGLATMAVLEQEQLPARAARAGNVLRTALTEMAGRYQMLAGVRGRGLMLGVWFRPPRPGVLRLGYSTLSRGGPGVFAQCVSTLLMERHRILTAVAGPGLNAIRLTPPLTVSDAELREFLHAFGDVMDRLHDGPWPMFQFTGRLAGRAAASLIPAAP